MNYIPEFRSGKNTSAFYHIIVHLYTVFEFSEPSVVKNTLYQWYHWLLFSLMLDNLYQLHQDCCNMTRFHFEEQANAVANLLKMHTLNIGN